MSILKAIMPKQKTSCVLFLLMLVGSWFTPAQSQIQDFSDFSAIVILDQGRKKPLDTYARHTLLTFSSRSSYKKMPAIEVFAKIMFTPDSTKDYQLFMVNNMEAIEALGLTLEHSRKFSYNQLEPGIEKLRTLAAEISEIEEKQRSLVQNEILKMFENISTYVRLASTFQFALPNQIYAIKNAELAGYLGYEPAPAEHSYFEILSKAAELHKFLSGMKTGKDAAMNPVEQEVVRLSQEMYTWARYYVGMPIPILPSTGGHAEEVWLSPWTVLSNFYNQQHLSGEVDHLNNMATGYLAGDQKTFSTAARKFNASVKDRVAGKLELGHSNLELTYNKVDPFLWSKVFYILGFIFALLSFSFWQKALYKFSWGFLGTAFLLNTLGIALRMIITNRPPVTNLFETFLFVAWVSALVSGIGELIQRKGIGLITATFSGFSLLMVAEKYALDGDTMGMLVAVLDSNFWLSTHVVTITMGYAGCCAAGVAGHIYLVQKVFGASPEKLKDTFKSIYGIMAFGLTLSFIGTVLGGIWADQSWGRFWGWDPKENGALLIVLWCSILFHCRMDGLIREVGFAAGAVLGGIIVMFAWFGVNLLGVGLHSYGFSSGVFIKLFAYYAFEVVFVVVTVGLIVLKRNQTKVQNPAQ